MKSYALMHCGLTQASLIKSRAYKSIKCWVFLRVIISRILWYLKMFGSKLRHFWTQLWRDIRICYLIFCFKLNWIKIDQTTIASINHIYTQLEKNCFFVLKNKLEAFSGRNCTCISLKLPVHSPHSNWGSQIQTIVSSIREQVTLLWPLLF